MPALHTRFAVAFGLLIFGLLLAGCSPDPLEESTDRFEALVDLLEDHKHDDEELLEQLESFVDTEKANFVTDRERLDALSTDELDDLRAQHGKRLRAVLERLFNVTLEIQDRLRSRPDKLLKFQELLAELHGGGQ